MEHIVKILAIEHITHDVLRIETEKPKNYSYQPGQATDVSINQPEWREKLNAFTFTSLPKDKTIEFTIKTYPSHHGVTNQLLQLKKNDELILHDVFGTILYRGEGIFIAGGAGVTPFISIFRNLKENNEVQQNKLLFANKTKADIINENEFKTLLNEQFVSILSDEKIVGHEYGYITEEIIKKHLLNSSTFVYLCGPDSMMDAMEGILLKLGVKADYIIKESF